MTIVEQTQQIAQTPTEERLHDRENTVELLSFRLGAEGFCLELKDIREIRLWSEPTPLPHAPDSLAGVINLRGSVLPVVDLSVKLGLPSITATGRRIIIIAERHGRKTGLVVSSVSEILTLRNEDLVPAPEVSENGASYCVAALFVTPAGVARVLDLAALMPTQAAGTQT